MPARATPKATTHPQAARSYPRSRGRHTTASSSAPNTSRRVTTPATPTAGNSSVARAAPACTDTAAPSTIATGTAGAAGRGSTGVVGAGVTPPTLGAPARGTEMPVPPRLCSPGMAVGLRHLRAFVAIADEGAVTRAAARLHMTQPALSRTLQQLETHLGVRLVERSSHHLELTPAGHAYRARAVAALAGVDDVLDPTRAATWPLRLGHAWSGLGAATTAVLRAWQDAHPDVALELLRLDDRTAGLASGRADVAVVREPVVLPGVRTAFLTREDRLAAVATDGPLARHAALTLADLAGHPVAINTVSGTTTSALWPAGARPRATVEVANTDDWWAAIAAGRAVGVTTTATASMYPHPAVTYVPLSDAAPVEVRLAWREPPTHPGVPALVDLVVALVGC